MSVPRDVSQVPVFYNSYVTGRPGSGKYHDVTEQDAMYPFGFGLGYTTFDFSPTEVKDGVAVCTVTNTGAREGVATAQFYIQARNCEGGVRPIRELRGFRKVALKPGESKTVTFALDDAALRYTDRAGNYRVDAGTYRVVISADSRSGTFVDYVRE